MNKYVVSLTNNFIGAFHFDEAYKLMPLEVFMTFAKQCLLGASELRDMSDETLGKLMCSFEAGDMRTTKAELFRSVDFDGTSREMVREMAAFYLACAIIERLNEHRSECVPPYRRRGGNPVRDITAKHRAPAVRIGLKKAQHSKATK